jgi:hypothetical protein
VAPLHPLLLRDIFSSYNRRYEANIHVYEEMMDQNISTALSPDEKVKGDVY